MQVKLVKELMVPLAEYSRVNEEASLFDAMQALERAFAGPATDPARPKDRAVLVQAHDGRVLGKVSLWDVLRGLEPRYDNAIQITIDDYFLWTHSLFVNIAEKARGVKVKSLLREFSQHELIDENAALDFAIHSLVHYKLLSLLVTRDGTIVGILRLSDVFRAVTDMITTAESEPA